MKKLILASLFVAGAALAVDIEKTFVPGFSVPASVPAMAKAVDKNFEAVNASLALKATSLTVTYTTNRIIFLNATTNLATNNIIVPSYTIAVTP